LFLFNEPSPQRIARFLEAQRDAPFSYDEVGASREGAKAPTGYAVDHNRARLGRGRDTFERAFLRGLATRWLGACSAGSRETLYGRWSEPPIPGKPFHETLEPPTEIGQQPAATSPGT
jgi:hypothetical protein